MAADAPPRVIEDCRGALRVLSDGTVVRSLPPIAAAGDPEGLHADDPTVEWIGRTPSTTRRSAWASASTSPPATGTRTSSPSSSTSTAAASATAPTRGPSSTRPAAASPRGSAPSSSPPITASPPSTASPPPLTTRPPSSSGSATASPPTPTPGSPPAPTRPGSSSPASRRARGVLAHHMNVRFYSSSSAPPPLHPVRLRGFVPLMPFFTGGGGEPTPSELACPDGAFLDRDMAARYVRLSLAAGAAADHPFLNPFSPDAAPVLVDGVDVGPTLVVVAGDDMLRDRNVEYVRRLQEMGKPAVEAVVFPGQGHAFFSLRPWSEAVDELVRVVKGFVDKVCSG